MDSNETERNQSTDAVEPAAYKYADMLRDLVSKRIGVSGRDLQCPREKSFMTPCVARDGRTAVCERFGVPEICVGCEVAVEFLLKKELEITPTDDEVPF